MFLCHWLILCSLNNGRLSDHISFGFYLMIHFSILLMQNRTWLSSALRCYSDNGRLAVVIGDKLPDGCFWFKLMARRGGTFFLGALGRILYFVIVNVIGYITILLFHIDLDGYHFHVWAALNFSSKTADSRLYILIISQDVCEFSAHCSCELIKRQSTFFPVFVIAIIK